MNLPGAARHVADEDLEPGDDRCPLCGSDEPRKRLFVVQTAPDVHWLRCRTCGGSSASRMPTADYLDRYYADYYDDGDAKVTVGRPQRLADHIAGLLPQSDGRVTIIDFGGGDGTVARLLARRLAAGDADRPEAVWVVDDHAAGEWVVDGVRTTGVPSLDELGDVRAEVILASAVLEHVPECDAVMRSLLDRLAPGGHLYARTPYRVPLKRIAPWISMQFPMHVHDLGPSFWNRIQRRHPDVEVVVSQPSMVAAPLAGASIPSALVAHALKLPARVERRARHDPVDYGWRFVGGWEVLIGHRTPA